MIGSSFGGLGMCEPLRAQNKWDRRTAWASSVAQASCSGLDVGVVVVVVAATIWRESRTAPHEATAHYARVGHADPRNGATIPPSPFPIEWGTAASHITRIVLVHALCFMHHASRFRHRPLILKDAFRDTGMAAHGSLPDRILVDIMGVAGWPMCRKPRARQSAGLFTSCALKSGFPNPALRSCAHHV